jgi:hypothetical protein
MFAPPRSLLPSTSRKLHGRVIPRFPFRVSVIITSYPNIIKSMSPFKEGGPVCIECIRRHLLIQFRDRGPLHITCVHAHTSDTRFNNDKWTQYALGFLPKTLHEEYRRQMFEHWWHRADKWVCQEGCTPSGLTLVPEATPGYPHVECPGCQGRYCARCGKYLLRIVLRLPANILIVRTSQENL